MMPEAKVLEKIRKVLIADSTVKSYVEDRVYASHISSVDRPVYPAISLHLMDSRAASNIPDMSDMTIQIDLWLPIKLYDLDDVMTLYGTVRGLLHMQSLTDTAVDVKVQTIRESAIGPVMTDEDSNCRHLPARYRVVAI